MSKMVKFNGKYYKLEDGKCIDCHLNDEWCGCLFKNNVTCVNGKIFKEIYDKHGVDIINSKTIFTHLFKEAAEICYDNRIAIPNVLIIGKQFFEHNEEWKGMFSLLYDKNSETLAGKFKIIFVLDENTTYKFAYSAKIFDNLFN